MIQSMTPRYWVNYIFIYIRYNTVTCKTKNVYEYNVTFTLLLLFRIKLDMLANIKTWLKYSIGSWYLKVFYYCVQKHQHLGNRSCCKQMVYLLAKLLKLDITWSKYSPWYRSESNAFFINALTKPTSVMYTYLHVDLGMQVLSLIHI